MSATTHTLEGLFEKSRGVIGRYPSPDERYVFEFDSVEKRFIHMVGVPRPVHVEFFVDGESVREETLRPWVGMARGRCDRVVETRPEVAG